MLTVGYCGEPGRATTAESWVLRGTASLWSSLLRQMLWLRPYKGSAS